MRVAGQSGGNLLVFGPAFLHVWGHSGVNDVLDTFAPAAAGFDACMYSGPFRSHWLTHSNASHLLPSLKCRGKRLCSRTRCRHEPVNAELFYRHAQDVAKSILEKTVRVASMDHQVADSLEQPAQGIRGPVASVAEDEGEAV